MQEENSRESEYNNELHRIMTFRIAFIFIIICLSLFLLLFYSPFIFEPHRYILLKLLSLGHIPLFGLIAWTVLLAINLKKPVISDWPIWSYVAAFLFTLGISFMSELVQIITPRDASIKDFFLNSLGSSVFLGAGLLWANQEFSKRYGSWHKRLRFIFAAVTIILCVFAVRPLVLIAIDEIQKKESFPVIASFETKRELKRWEGGNNDLRLSQEHVKDGQYSLRVALAPGKYSGIHIAHPPNDWRGFNSFDFTVFNQSEKSLNIMLKIFDWEHNYEYSDRFNRLIRLKPGENNISIPFRDIASAPEKRKMRMDKIGQVSFFVRDLKEKQILYFDNIRLLQGKNN